MNNLRDIAIKHRGLKVVAFVVFVLVASWILAQADEAVHEQYKNNEFAMTAFYAAFVIATGLFYDVAKSCLSESSHPPFFGLVAVPLSGWAAIREAGHGELGWFWLWVVAAVGSAIWTYRHFHGEKESKEGEGKAA